MSGQFDGKVVVVTGIGGDNIGRAAALLFAERGAKVVGCDLVPEGAEETVEAVRRAGGEMVSLAPCDLTSEEDAQRLVELATSEYGRVDVLFNNAGSPVFKWLEDLTREDWDSTLRSELDTVFVCTKAFWPLLKQSRGAVVNTSSIQGIRAIGPNPALAHVAAKGGVTAITRQFAMEGAQHGIRVNCVSPGPVATPATRALLADPAWTEPMLRHIMLKRFGAPHDVACGVAFLASEDASYITGVDLPIDGGWTAW